MRTIKSKYIKILFTIICLFFVHDKVNAETYKYTVSENTIYNELTAVYSIDKSNGLVILNNPATLSGSAGINSSEDTEGFVGFKNNLDKKYIKCNGAEIPYGVPYIIYRIINLLKVAAPIILIVMGMLDFLKATTANDEKQMKDSTGKFIKRIIAAVIIFFVVVVIQFIFKQIGEKGEEALGCISCFVSGECSPYEVND